MNDDTRDDIHEGMFWGVIVIVAVVVIVGAVLLWIGWHDVLMWIGN